jgi:hypothetical protein
MQIIPPTNGRSGGYGIALKIMPPIMGTSGKSIAARPKRILIGIIQSNSKRRKGQ